MSDPPVAPEVNGGPQAKPVVDRGPNWPYVPAQFQKGQSGNPKGYSTKRRFTDGMLGYISDRKADNAILTVWLKEILDGNRHYFKMLLDRAEGAVRYRDDEVVSSDQDGPQMDAAMAERILLAAAPELLPDFDEEDPG